MAFFNLDRVFIMIRTVLFLVTLYLSGCATIFEGTTQSFMIRTARDNAKDTLCSAVNEEGNWPSLIPLEATNIRRDGNTLLVKCENDAQKGALNVEPNFKGAYIFLDALLDFCTISCVVDAFSNSFYEYPSMVVVPMLDKN
jgi:hypothetical protein